MRVVEQTDQFCSPLLDLQFGRGLTLTSFNCGETPENPVVSQAAFISFQVSARLIGVQDYP